MSSTVWLHHRFLAVFPRLIVIATIAAFPSARFAAGATWEKSTGPRATLNLSGDWKLSPLQFSKARPAAPAEDAPQARPAFDDSAWSAVAVPGDWFGVFWERFKDQVPAEEPAFIDGWYRTSFQVPSSANGRFLLQFDAVDYVASVYVNGRRVGVHVGTWSPFQFDITPYVRAGEPNVLAVHVMMDVPNFGGGLEHARGYRARKILKFNLGGIHQPVRLAHVPDTRVSRTLIDPRVGEQRVDAIVELEAIADGEVLVSAEVLPWPVPDANAAAVATAAPQSVRLQQGRGSVQISIPGENLKRWDLDSPNLYVLRTRITQADGGVIDVADQRFGYRQFQTRGKSFLLNDRPIYPFGECIVWVDKMDREGASPEWALGLIRELKKNNYNFIRLHAGPAPIWMHELCDEQGMMLMPEWGHGINPDFEQEFSEMRDWMLSIYSSPSVVMWSLRNESPERERDAKMYRRLRAVDKTSRPMTATAGGDLFEMPTVVNTDLYDTHLYYGVGGYPVSFMVPAYEYLHRKVASFPGGGNRPFILTESNIVRGGDITRAVPDEQWAPLTVDEYLQRAAALENSDPDKHAKVMPLASINALSEEQPSWQGAQFVKKLVELFRIRDDLLQGTIPWQSYVSQGRHNFQPVFVGTDLNYANKAEFAGTAHAFSVYVRSFDSRTFPQASINVRIEDLNGKTVLRGAPLEAGDIAPGTRLDLKYKWQLPDDLPTGDYLLKLEVSSDSTAVSTNLYELYILGKAEQSPVLTPMGRVAVLRPRGLNGPNKLRMTKILDSLKIRHTVVTSVQNLSAYKVLIVPPFYGTVPLERKPILGAAMAFVLTEERDAFKKLAEREKVRWEDVYPELIAGQDQLREWIRNGGRVLAFEQFVAGPVPWQPELTLVDSGFNTFIDPVRRDHPAFAKLMIRDFADWENELGVIVDYSIAPLTKDVLAAVSNYGYAGNAGGVRMAISESAIGDGRSVLSQANAIRRYGDDAIATHYVNQLLRHVLCEDSPSATAPATD